MSYGVAIPRFHLIRGLIPKFVFTVVALCSVFNFSSMLRGQDSDQGFRDFGFVEPAELYRRLSAFRPEETSGSNFDMSQLRDLAKQGQSLFSSLTPKQQEDVREFAERYLDEKGLESDASKALMNQLGLPRDLQESLAEKFNRLEGRDAHEKSGFRDVLRAALQSSKDLKLDRDGQKRVANRQGAKKATDRRKGIDRVEGDSSDRPGTDIEPEAVTPEQTKPQDGNKVGTAKTGAQAAEDLAKGKGISENNGGKTPSQIGAKVDPLAPTKNGVNIDDPLGTNSVGSFDKNDDPMVDSIIGAETKSPNVGPLEGLAAGDSSGEKRGEFDWEKNLSRLLGGESGRFGEISSDNEVMPKKRGDRGNAELDSSFSQKLAGLAPGQDSINRFMMRNSSDGDGGADSNNSAKERPRLAAEFDQTVVEAARGVLESQSDSESDQRGFFARNFDSVFKRLVNRTVSPDGDEDSRRETPRFDSDDEGWDQEGRSGAGGSSMNSDWINRQRSSRRTADGGIRNEERRNAPSELNKKEETSSQSSTDGHAVGVLSSSALNLLFGLAIGGVIFAFLLTALNRKSGNNADRISDRAVARRIDRAKFHSPQDLVALVDLFLISKFGTESMWWNAKHAENILLSDAPEFESNINELVQSYVRLRYMKVGGELTQIERDNCRTTLKSLASILGRTDLSTRLKVEG